jgi:hypothetical protein
VIHVFTVLREAGYEEAMLGLSLNKLQPPENMPNAATKLTKAQAGSHRKFLRQISVWLRVVAPMCWWAEFDCYKVGTCRQSSSTMHRPIEHSGLHDDVPLETLEYFETIHRMFVDGSIGIQTYKNAMPAGVMLDSVVSMNYEVLRTILFDRYNHRLDIWKDFCRQIHSQLQHKELIVAPWETSV